MTTDCHSMSDPVTTPSDHTYWSHALISPTSHNFKPYISFWAKIESCTRNVRLKLWLVGVASRCGRWVWSLSRTLNDNQRSCLWHPTLLSFFFQLHHDQSSALHHTIFLKNVFFIVIFALFGQRSYFCIIIM